MGQVQVRKLFDNSQYVAGCLITSSINCALVAGSPRVAWLIRKNPADIEYSIVFKDPSDAYALKGVWVIENGRGILVDGALSDFVAKCDECCGEDKNVAPIYDGVYPVEPSPLAKDYTVVRTDDGSLRAQQDFMYDYLGKIIPNTLSRSARDEGAGTSTYVFKSYRDPGAYKTDTITETSRTYDSNVPGALAGAEDAFKMTATIDGLPLALVSAASLAALATALTAAFGTTYGTWSTTGGLIRLTSKVIDYATLVVTKYDSTP